MSAFWVNPLLCWLINAFGLKRRLHWLPLFVLACIFGYVLLMLVVASQLFSDALARRGIDATAVVGDGRGSDAGLALAPMLGVPVSVIWTAISFGILSIIQWSYRTDFLSIFRRNTRAGHLADFESPDTMGSETDAQ